MGTGEKAREYSKITLRLIKQLLSAGFNKEESVNLINSRLNMFEENERFSTLDATILDLFIGKIEILKSGACATFIKNKKEIRKIQSETMPLGADSTAEVQSQTEDIEDGEIIIMCSDGVLDSKGDYGVWMEDFIKKINTNSVQKIADLILAEALDNNFGVAQDDMTVIVSKVVKRKTN
jgi:stage II sporulation protein E